ncbi:unnamed protein product [marine sediment metagenome]|uniref:Uncharacterized protein n=1 Tax=marine sediment metagenome TaxID=412755 RepID=X1AA79_9ZZZZ
MAKIRGVHYKDTKSPGDIENLGITVASNTITFHGADGSALSTINPASITCRSQNNLGRIVTLKLTANVSIAESDLTNYIFGGITTARAWDSPMPLYFYAVNKDDTDAGLGIAFTRNSIGLRTSATANYHGWKGTANKPVTNNQSNWIHLASSDPSADDKVVELIGGVRMTMDASDDWTFSTFLIPFN